MRLKIKWQKATGIENASRDQKLGQIACSLSGECIKKPNYRAEVKIVKHIPKCRYFIT